MMYSQNNKSNQNNKSRMYEILNIKNEVQPKQTPTPIIFNKGVVSTITLGDKTFDVLSPKTLKQVYDALINSETKYNNTISEVNKLNSKINQLTNTVNAMSQELSKLRSEIMRIKNDRLS